MDMKRIRIEKIVLNIGCGTTVNTEHAKTVLELITASKPVITITKKRSMFGVPKSKPIGCKVTIRKNTNILLKKLLEAKENKLNKDNFDDTGNLSFGIKEYIDIPDMEYDPKIGILGFDVSIALERPGYSVKRKKINSKIGKKHKITKEEAIEFIRKDFGVEIE